MRIAREPDRGANKFPLVRDASHGVSPFFKSRVTAPNWTYESMEPPPRSTGGADTFISDASGLNDWGDDFDSEFKGNRATRAMTITLSDKSRDLLLAHARRTSASVLREAVRATTSLSALRGMSLLEADERIALYGYKTNRSSASRMTALNASRGSEPPTVASADNVPRVFGLGQIHSPLKELVEIIGHPSPLSFVLLNPGVDQHETLELLAGGADEYTAIKTMTMQRRWHASVDRQRDFVVVEDQRLVKTEDGRHGWMVSYHSTNWRSCSQPSGGVVRGGMYRTGLVVLESPGYPERLELFAVSSINVKGNTTERTNSAISRDRIMHTLMLLTKTIEQRAATELSLVQSFKFRKMNKEMRQAPCRACMTKIGKTRRNAIPYRCRKCCVSICGGCSVMWRRGSKEMRLCLECWAYATLNRL